MTDADAATENPELAALRAAAAAMQKEIDELHRQIDGFHARELELTRALEASQEGARRDANAQADAIVLEARQRAAALRTEGLVQVGELQQQVEQLLALRAGLTAALRQATSDIADALERVAAGPARAVEQLPAPEPLAGRPASELEAWLARRGWPTT